MQQAIEVAHTLVEFATLSASPTTYYIIPRCIEQLLSNEML